MAKVKSKTAKSLKVQFGRAYKKLIKNTELADVSSSFAMERIKTETALPLTYVALKR